LRGAVYLFEQGADGTWNERATVVPPVQDNLAFGLASAALSGDARTLVLGAGAVVDGSIYPRAFVY
ncbi:MAG TPA: hypothetical protein VFR86_14170, partial [Burkholderiaceae bacterium]|nr:hypothetical protein [Burkholderiaceae bacterium]